MFVIVGQRINELRRKQLNGKGQLPKLPQQPLMTETKRLNYFLSMVQLFIKEKAAVVMVVVIYSVFGKNI